MLHSHGSVYKQNLFCFFLLGDFKKISKEIFLSISYGIRNKFRWQMLDKRIAKGNTSHILKENCQNGPIGLIVVRKANVLGDGGLGIGVDEN